MVAERRDQTVGAQSASTKGAALAITQPYLLRTISPKLPKLPVKAQSETPRFFFKGPRLNNIIRGGNVTEAQSRGRLWKGLAVVVDSKVGWELGQICWCRAMHGGFAHTD